MAAEPVDVLAVLREYAQDTGSFRVTKQAAARLAAACAAAAELVDKAARHIHAVDHPVNDGDDAARQARTLRALNAALTNFDHWSHNHDR